MSSHCYTLLERFWDWLRETAPLLAVALLILACFGAMIWSCVVDGRRKYSRQTYELWVKIEHRTDLSYEEWKAARRAGLILQEPETAVVPVFVPTSTR